jgi:ribosomal protein S27AE
MGFSRTEVLWWKIRRFFKRAYCGRVGHIEDKQNHWEMDMTQEDAVVSLICPRCGDVIRTLPLSEHARARMFRATLPV